MDTEARQLLTCNFMGIMHPGCSPSCCPKIKVFHFFFATLAADLVEEPSAALGVVALMTPTATVCLMSLTVNLFLDLSELTGDMGSVAIKHGTVSIGDLSRVVKDDDLGGEVGNTTGRLVLGVGSNISSLDILHRDILDVESNIVSGDSFGEGLVVHLDGLNLSGKLIGGEGDNLTWLDNTGLYTTHGHCSNSSNFVNILEGKSEGLVCWPM